MYKHFKMYLIALSKLRTKDYISYISQCEEHRHICNSPQSQVGVFVIWDEPENLGEQHLLCSSL